MEVAHRRLLGIGGDELLRDGTLCLGRESPHVSVADATAIGVPRSGNEQYEQAILALGKAGGQYGVDRPRGPVDICQHVFRGWDNAVFD